MIFVDEEWHRRRSRAVETISRCKWMDGLKGGKTVQTIAVEGRELDQAYYQEINRMLDQAQDLNADPQQIPIKLYSFNELSDGSLAEMKLTEITQRYLEANGRAPRKGYNCYYNEAFYWQILTFYEQVIAVNNLEAINYISDAWDKPVVYLHDPISPVRDETQWSSLLDHWHRTHAVYTERSSNTSTEEWQSSRGDFWVNREYPYGRLYQADQKQIYQIESLMLFDFLYVMYRLSEEHSECFGKGAQAILDGLYAHYKEILFGDREMDQPAFELKFTQQFIYMTDDRIELRIDLYRHLDELSNTTEFIGGLFHAFDHFQGLNFSKGNSSIQLHEDFLFDVIRDMLFNHLPDKRQVFKKGETYEIHREYNTPMHFENEAWVYSNKNWCGVFHYSFDKKCFSLTTIHPE